MPVSLRHVSCTVDSLRERASDNLRRPCAQPHACAFVTDATLLFQQRDHGLWGIFVELSAICVFDSTDVPREFNSCHLHAKAETKIRNLLLARVTGGIDFSFSSASAKSARNQDAGHILKLAIDALLQRFGIDKFEIDFAIFVGPSVGERFVDTFVGVTDIHVFADHGDLDVFTRTDDPLDEFSPICQIGFGGFEVQKIAHQLVKSLRMQGQWHLVNRMLDVAFLDHRFLRNAAKHRQFSPHIGVKRFFGAANQHLGLQTDLTQLGHTLLRRLCFQLMCGLDVRNKRNVHVQHILQTDFENELPDRFQKWKTFNIASRAANFCDDDVVFALVGKFADAIFNHISDVWDHLHGFAQIIATPFL